MCYQYNREFRRDIKKDEAKEPKEKCAPGAPGGSA